jgi:hypothetical protein
MHDGVREDWGGDVGDDKREVRLDVRLDVCRADGKLGVIGL